MVARICRRVHGNAVCDLTKEHLNLFFKPLTEVGTKNRNDRRAAVKMFLTWATRQDYLPVNHRLFEANGMTRETVEAADTDFFRPAELKNFWTTPPPNCAPCWQSPGLPVCALKKSCAWIGRTCGALRDTLNSQRAEPRSGSVALWKSAPRSMRGLNHAAIRSARFIRLVSMFSGADLRSCATA